MNDGDNEGLTPLHWSIMLNKPRICSYLLRHPHLQLDPRHPGETGDDVIRVQSPVHLAISRKGQEGEVFLELLCQINSFPEVGIPF